MAIPRLSEAFAAVEDLYVNAEYRERPDYRFRHDAKPHAHDALAAQVVPTAPFPLRHWTIQDVFNTEYLHEMLRVAAQYGMTGIQFSGDNLYWVNDALHRYNTYVFVGELCERCHDLGLEAYFWVHEINGFFHEFVQGGRYGFSGQLAAGTIDLSSTSGIWEILYEKYDVFFRRLPGVNGLVLTLNECQVPVFRDEGIRSDLDAAHRVAKIGQTVKAACDAHGKRLILRTFCYTPEETERVREGVRLIGPDVTVMIKCVPHDWQTFYPHDPLIAALGDFPRIVEFDLAHEPMGAGRFPYPDTEHLTHRFAHATAQGAIGVAGRIDRFRNHAHGTLNWANVSAFSRLAQAPEVPAATLRQEYAAADWGDESAPWIADLTARLYTAGQEVYFLGKEWGSAHSNLNAFEGMEHTGHWSRARWAPGDGEATATLALLKAPTPAFIAEIAREKDAAVEDLRRLCAELDAHRGLLAPADAAYLDGVLPRAVVVAEALTTQHLVMLMVRHDAPVPVGEGRYAAEIADALARLRALAVTERRRLLDGGNEGCQYGPELLERFCRNAERHLRRASGE
jgi:hypothetical protein